MNEKTHEQKLVEMVSKANSMKIEDIANAAGVEKATARTYLYINSEFEFDFVERNDPSSHPADELYEIGGMYGAVISFNKE